jgi:hypothetical protein
MTTREYLKTQIDILPERAIGMLCEYIQFQKFCIGLYDNDTEYLSSIPGMVSSIKAAAGEPLEEGIDADSVDFNVFCGRTRHCLSRHCSRVENVDTL